MKQGKINISVLDLTVLMYNVYHSVPIIGYNDAHKTLEELIYSVNSRVKIDADLAERLLYCSNLLDEKGKFWHYTGKSFDNFLKTQKWQRFDKGRNYFKGNTNEME